MIRFDTSESIRGASARSSRHPVSTADATQSRGEAAERGSRTHQVLRQAVVRVTARGRGASGQGGQDDRGDEEAAVDRPAHSSGFIARSRDDAQRAVVTCRRHVNRARRNPYVARRRSPSREEAPGSRSPRRKIPCAKRRSITPVGRELANRTARRRRRADGSAGSAAYRSHRPPRRQERALQDGSSMTPRVRRRSGCVSMRPRL